MKKASVISLCLTTRDVSALSDLSLPTPHTPTPQHRSHNPEPTTAIRTSFSSSLGTRRRLNEARVLRAHQPTVAQEISRQGTGASRPLSRFPSQMMKIFLVSSSLVRGNCRTSLG
ncbi:hypothetical protein EJ04DRAFT_231295 [Polyplosphaeria fusca]|uniref:Uncharacterized protein n=1 Tax=Polyplosphaeria fusca TaxID=682080 RepID=A0A9P4QVI1_9PLEO|nr:hypothetical protein EJ04DRAFT_231295 [Polyplosphaeria fusca]